MYSICHKYSLQYSVSFGVVLRKLSSFQNFLKKSKPAFPETRKQKRMMDKIMQNMLPEQLTSDMARVKLVSSKQTRKGQFLGNRRLPMLTNMLLETITDIMSTGSVALQLGDHSIEVTKVQLTKNGDTVKVHWRCGVSSDENNVEGILKSAAPKIRHEILDLRLMGHVPYIEFVRDCSESSQVVLDRLFETADYGEDYEPLDSSVHAASPIIPSPLSDSLKKQINAEIGNIRRNEDKDMKMDVFGLNHERIMNEVKLNMRRTGAEFKKTPPENMAVHFSASKNFENYLINKRKAQLKKEKLSNRMGEELDWDTTNRYEDDKYEDVNVEDDSYDEPDSLDHK